MFHLQIQHIPTLLVHKNPFCHGKVSFQLLEYSCTIIYFIAWDLLRIDVYGFRGLTEWFFKTYPTYFIAPLRLSGSSVESPFSQYKHSSGGKLDAVNYFTSRAAHLVKQSVTTHYSGKQYQDEPLNIIEFHYKKKNIQQTCKFKQSQIIFMYTKLQYQLLTLS